MLSIQKTKQTESIMPNESKQQKTNNTFMQKIKASIKNASKKLSEKMNPSSDTIELREQNKRAKQVKKWKKIAEENNRYFDTKGAQEYIKNGSLFCNGQDDMEIRYYKLG